MAPVLKIRPEWDRALTYDVLPKLGEEPTRGGAATRPVFVGRRDLLDIIAGTVRQPDRRGTFLVSGYRGAGKTTLLIEAICRAGEGLAQPWRLLPLVLNASEVAASLGPAAPGPTLQIGPQQLLTALIRTLRNVAEDEQARAAASPIRPASLFQGELIEAIRDTFRKANAKEYSRSESKQTQETESRTREVELKVNVADVFKGVTAVTAMAAVGLESSAWLTAGTAGIHTGAAALAGAAILSGAHSWKLSRTAKEEQVRAVSVKFDGSLQQLEGDLKDVLAKLQERKLRTVVVLEELDKLRDEDGQQLDAVIRYFKNLFTQAPALFFFVTDKAYYDFISSEIRGARRQRSYAIQHTFFTHRLFVGRPTTRDCLDYLKSIVVDPEAAAPLDALYAADPFKPFSDEISKDPLLRLVRYVLFKASNHLFDLKNELRRFVRTEGAELVIDAGLLTDDEAMVGGLQDLVFEKVRSFAIGDGRAYANEVLNDCLYAVFNDLGSDVEQSVTGFYPRALATRLPGPTPATEDPAAAQTPPAGGGAVKPLAVLGAEDQLELTEQIRIKEAVDSMIADLYRGDAFEAEKTNTTEGRFVWKRTAARAFRFKRQLEAHERDLANYLERVRAELDLLRTVLQAHIGLAHVDEADRLVIQLVARSREIQTAGRALSISETEDETLLWQRRASEPIDAAYRAHLDRAAGYGMGFVDVGGSQGGRLFLLETPLGDPRDPTHQSGGAVLVAQGEGGRLRDDAREFVAGFRNLQRLAIIHVYHAPVNSGIGATLAEKWRADLVEGMRRDIPGMAVPRILAVDPLRLDEEWVSDRWGEKLAERLLFRAAWIALAITAAWPAADLTGFIGAADGDVRSERLVDVVLRWLGSQHRILRVTADSRSSSEFVIACVEAMRSPEVSGAIGLPLGRIGPVESLTQQLLRTAGVREDKDTRVPELVVSLVGQRVVIPIVDGTDEMPANFLTDVLGNGGRAMVVAPASWTPVDANGEPLSTLTFTPTAARA